VIAGRRRDPSRSAGCFEVARAYSAGYDVGSLWSGRKWPVGGFFFDRPFVLLGRGALLGEAEPRLPLDRSQFRPDNMAKMAWRLMHRIVYHMAGIPYDDILVFDILAVHPIVEVRLQC